MPVEGLQSTVEGALSALIKENPLTSFKIDGRGDNIVVVLRFLTGQPNDTATRRYRLKPPSQLARDERRADIRKGQVSGDRSPMPLFMPTPPSQLTEKSHEMNYMTSHLTGLHQRDKTFQDYIARESRSAAAEVTLDSECFVCDVEQPPDVKSGAMHRQVKKENATRLMQTVLIGQVVLTLLKKPKTTSGKPWTWDYNDD